VWRPILRLPVVAVLISALKSLAKVEVVVIAIDVIAVVAVVWRVAALPVRRLLVQRRRSVAKFLGQQLVPDRPSSQNIPQAASATPSSTNCICQKSKTGRGFSFGNDHKLLGMNALLFIIAPLPTAAKLEMVGAIMSGRSAIGKSGSNVVASGGSGRQKVYGSF
jgi:hypothetical protein